MVTGAQKPRIKIVPKGRDHPKWREVVDFVNELGVDLDPWQWMVLRASLRRSKGLWAAFTVAVCAPRQNGKNSLIEVRELIGPLILGERLLIHTAHLADTSKEGFHRLDDLIDSSDWVRKQVKHIWRANGMETIEFKGGKRIRFRTRTRGGGRGYAGCNTAFFDESMFLPEVSLGSVLPVISAMPDPQIWYTGSAVDQEIMEDGVVFARVRERALKGDTERLAYFEWSLDADNPDAVDDDVSKDPASWAATNPAFGRRIMPEYLKVERDELDPRTFAVERLGVGDWPATTKRASVIDLDKWAQLADPESTIDGPVVFAFDVKPDRSASAISVAGTRADGIGHIEVVERRKGTGWVVPRLLELCAKHDAAAVVCDPYGAAGSLVPELDENRIEVTTASGRDAADACGLFYDAVENGTLRHLGTPELLAALKGAVQRPLGDAWAWSRKNSTIDISPLVACTLALWGAQTARPSELFALAW